MKERERKRHGIRSGGAGVSAVASDAGLYAGAGGSRHTRYTPAVRRYRCPDFVPGEVVVSLWGDWRDALQGLLDAAAGLLSGDAASKRFEARAGATPRSFDGKAGTAGAAGHREACDLLSRLPMVEMAEPNYIFRAAETTPNDTSYTMQWDLRKVGASRAWDVERGSDAFTVAVIDTGVDYSSQEFASRCVPGYDYFHNDPDPMDDDGHGTAVASVSAPPPTTAISSPA